MVIEEMSPAEQLQLRNPAFAAFLGWLIPGMGHWYQGRYSKGLLYFVCVLGIFFFGFQQGGWQIVYFRWDSQEWRWPYLAQAGAGLVALPALLPGEEWRGWMPEKLRDYEMAPSDAELDNLHRKYGKRIDIALVYTMVAGLLNILAVYDALAGPALYDEERRLLAGPPKNPALGDGQA
jgi:hypothetical protein